MSYNERKREGEAGLVKEIWEKRNEEEDLNYFPITMRERERDDRCGYGKEDVTLLSRWTLENYFCNENSSWITICTFDMVRGSRN